MQTAPRSDMFMWYILRRDLKLRIWIRSFRCSAHLVKKRILGAENLAGTAKCWRLTNGEGGCDVRVIMWKMYLEAEESPFVRAAILARYRGVPEEEVVCGFYYHLS